MDSLDHYRQKIESVLEGHTRIPYAYGDIQIETVFDRIRDRYLLVNVGWEDCKRVHGALVHVDIIDGKFWIQRDGTEEGIATGLLEAGVPKEHIVLGFRTAELRRHTEFAAA